MNYLTIFSKKQEHFSEMYLFQTYHNKSKIPDSVYENIKKYAPEYTHKVYDDNDCIQFLKEHYDENVLRTFTTLNRGPHKADLIRYCLLYTYGGIYLDIKTELIRPLRDIFVKDDIVYSVLSYAKDHIYQGILSTPPKHPLFLELIKFIVHTGSPNDYHLFCKDMYERIKKQVGDIDLGWNKSYYFFEERCSSDASQCYDGLDQHGLCCYVWDKNAPIIKTRRSSYPW